MYKATDSDILAKIGEFCLNTPNATKLGEDNIIHTNITDDIIQECIDYVLKEYPYLEDDYIIRIINDNDCQQKIMDEEFKKQLEHLKL